MLGRGALGSVFSAIDQRLERVVAIKAMRSSDTNPEFAARFAREARAMAKLNHPNIITIYDFGSEGDLHYIVMECASGGSLADELGKRVPVELKRATRIIKDVCEGLAHAHGLGIIHRDIKPGNILLDHEGHAKLSDFGLVKGLAPDEYVDTPLTKTGMSLGTPLYMAPELSDSPGTANQRADIYSVAAVYHEMLTGEPPKVGQQEDPVFVGVPPVLKSVFRRALHPRPEERYPAASEFIGDVHWRSDGKRRWWNRVGIAVALLSLVSVTVLLTQMISKPKQVYDNFSEEETRGLPLESFEKEIVLEEWFERFDYNFDEGLGDSAHKQKPLEISGNTAVENGRLNLKDSSSMGHANLTRDAHGPLSGLLVHLRFRAESFPSAGIRAESYLEFDLYEDARVRLVGLKWGDSNPAIILGRLDRLAPPGVIERHFTLGAWHEVWLALGDGVRLWIDGKAVYRSSQSANLDLWSKWTGQNTANLKVGGFVGQVDYVRVYEK